MTYYSLGIPFVSLDQLVSNVQYHISGDLFFRISYRTCYPCIPFTKVVQKLTYAFALDSASVFVLLVFTVLCRSLIKNTELFLGLNIYQTIFDVFKDTMVSVLGMVLLFYVNDTIHYIMELHVFFYHFNPVILCTTERIAYFLAHLGVVGGYPHGIKGLVILRPYWLLFAIELFYSNALINYVMVSCVTLSTVFFVNVYIFDNVYI